MTREQRSSDIFCRIHSDIDTLMKNLPDGDRRTEVMREEYSHTDLVEGYSTHIIAKGWKIYVDTRYTLPEIRYMVLHELGHMISVKYGHGREFWNNFSWLLDNAHMLGMETQKV